MNGVIDNDKDQHVVTSVGNAWVICDSKSRPGFKYYFNTLSGQAVWNLSPVEIEKAKRYTKGLPLSEIEKCPEPAMDPPMDPTMYPSHIATPRIYNDPFGRRQATNPNMFPMGMLNVNSMPGVPNMSGMNPLLWNPGCNPPSNPVIYVAYPQMNFQQPHEFPQMFPTQINEEPDSYRKTFINSRENDMFNRNNRMHDNMMGQSRFVQRNVQQTNKWDGNSSDLRQKLMRKRSKSLSSESAPVYEDCSYQDFHGQNKKVTVQMNTTESFSKYDLSALEKLKTPSSRARNWFVVVDTEIVLRNFPVLDKITDPDQDCYLMVPDHVMKELQELVYTEGDVQTRRILRFLSQQIEADLAFKGEDMTSIADDDDDGTYKMLATCEELAEQNNVILLSNNPNYQRNKNVHSNIHILTLDELKQILNKAQVKQALLRNKSPTLGVKIVVPNNRHRDKIVPTRLESNTPDFEVRSHTPKKKETIQTHPVPSSSRQKANIQEILNENTRTQFSVKYCDVVDHTTKTQESVRIAKRPMSPNLNNGDGAKEIKLFSSSNCKANSEDAPTRQYRWRKKRTLSEKNTNSSPVTNDQNICTNLSKQLEAALASSLMPERSLRSISPKPTLPTQAQTEASLSRSSICSHKDTSHMNIIVEETSTSGVISNTTLDSYSINPTHIKLKKTVRVCDELNFEMFGVAGHGVEEVLRTRREEWVLRFVQIMEETLKEILRVDSPFQSKCYDYTPMVTADLPELARCIIKKFSDHFNVVDAANRLSFKLQKINNEGAIIEPNQYMDMYSFGVYLINSLKNVTEDCEDLNTADESLKNLLFDIQNANQDTGHNDTFADELTESAINVTKPPPPEKKLPDEFPNGTSKKSDGQDHHNTNSKGNTLLPRTRSQINKQSQQRIKIVETQFFSSLALEKRKSPDNPSLRQDFQNTISPISPKIAQTPTPHVSPLPNTLRSSPVKLKATSIQAEPDDNNKDSTKSNSDQNLNTDKDGSSPVKTSFVRNFNSIPQFEDILNKKVQTANEFANDENDQGDYDNAAYADEYYDENVNTDCDKEVEEGEIEEDEIAGDLIEAHNDEENLNKENNEKCECFIKEFTDEIRRTIKIVLTLCIEFRGEVKNPLGPSKEVKDELKTACASIRRIKNALNSILCSESTSPENDVVLLLKKANLDDYVPSKERLLEYRNIISKCSDQVNACYAKVTQIMKVAGIQQLV